MDDIAAMLREATGSGRLTALTIWPSGNGWQVNARNAKNGWNCVTCTDVAAGVVKALAGPFTTPSVPSGKPTDETDKGVFG